MTDISHHVDIKSDSTGDNVGYKNKAGQQQYLPKVVTDPVTGGNIFLSGGSALSLISSPVEKLKSKFRKSPYLSVPEVMASPPAITEGSAGTGPAVATVRIIPWDGNTPQVNHLFNTPYLSVFNASKMSGTLLGQTPITMSGQEKFLMSTPVFPSNVGGLGMTCISFEFDGQDLEILHYGQLQFFGISNGKSFSASAISSGTASVSSWTRIAFGSREVRSIRIYVLGQVGSVAIGANDSISPVDSSRDISVVLHGDSYFTTTAERLPALGPGGEAALRCGFENMWGSGWGGAAYYYAGPSANANTAFADLSRVESCDIWHCSLGINETRAGVGAANFDAAVLQYYTAVRATFPNAVISATGPWAPTESSSKTANRTDISDAVLTQLRKISGPWVFVDNLRGTWENSSGKTGVAKVSSTSSTTSVNGGPSVNSGMQSPAQVGTWQTGEGKVGGTTGKGNGDLYVGADGTHPSPSGVTYLGSMIARGWRDSILAL